MKKIIICIMICLSLFSFTACAKTTGEYKYELTISHTEVTIEKNQGFILTAVYGDNKTAPTFSSSNQNVATVDTNGNVVAISEGYCYITARADGKEKTCRVNVIDPVYTVEVMYEKTDYVIVGAKVNFTAVCYKDGVKYSDLLNWSVSPSASCAFALVNSHTISFVASAVGEYEITVNSTKSSKTIVIMVVDETSLI